MPMNRFWRPWPGARAHAIRNERRVADIPDPVLLTKQCATIDMLSDGRLLPAFGIGSPLALNGRHVA